MQFGGPRADYLGAHDAAAPASVNLSSRGQRLELSEAGPLEADGFTRGLEYRHGARCHRYLAVRRLGSILSGRRNATRIADDVRAGQVR